MLLGVQAGFLSIQDPGGCPICLVAAGLGATLNPEAARSEAFRLGRVQDLGFQGLGEQFRTFLRGGVSNPEPDP